MTAINIVPIAFLNSQLYGTVGDGVTDDTANIQAALSAASGATSVDVWLTGSSGQTFLISTPLILPANVHLVGMGMDTTIIRASATFTGAQMLSLSDVTYCGIRDLTLQAHSPTYSSNPAFDGIDIVGCTDVRIVSVEIDYVNGWGILSQSTSGVGNTHITLDTVTTHLCAQGIHLLGNTGSSEVGSHRLVNTNNSGVQNGDGYLIEDIHDILGINMYGETTAGSGAALHIKGAVGACHLSNVDIGPSPGPSTGPVVQVSAGPNGTPGHVFFHGGIFEGGTEGFQINAGTNIHLIGCEIFNCNTSGVNISGTSSVLVTACNFYANGSVAGSGRYDFVNTSTGPVYVTGNKFDTPQGNGAGQVNSCISDIGGTGLGFYNGNCHNPLNGWTATNIYAGAVNPYSSSNVQGVLPTGNIAAPAFTGSPQSNTKSFPCTVYITGGTVTSIAIGGIATGLTSGSFDVPPHTAITVTYSVAPTWTWFTKST